MPMEEVFGLGLGASSVAGLPLPVFRGFRRAARDLKWAQLFRSNVGRGGDCGRGGGRNQLRKIAGKLRKIAGKLRHCKQSSVTLNVQQF